MSKKKKPVSVIPAKPVAPINPFLDNFETKTSWHLVILLLLPFFIYIKTSGFDFISFDDAAIITNNFNIIGNIHNIGIAFKSDAFIALHGTFYRPLQTVSFMVDAFIGSGRPLVFHITNLFLHLLTVVSLYYLLRALKIKNLTAFYLALLFSLHPLLSSAVSWVPSRGDLLIGLFGILLFNCFDKYFKTGKIIYFILHAVLFLLAIFSKEVAVLFPLLLLFYYFFVLKQSFILKKLAPFFIIWIVFFSFFYLLRSKVVTALPSSDILGINPFMENIAAIPDILSKFFIPVNLSTMPLFDNTSTIIGSLLFIAIVFVTVKYGLQKKWLAPMGVLWFLLFIIPPMFFKIYYSNFLIDYYEHRAYLPSVGLIILLAFLLNGKLFRASNQLLNLLPVAIIFLFAFLSSEHSDDFKNSMAFFSRAAELNNPGAYAKRGELYFSTRDFAKAQDDFNTAIELSGGQFPLAFYDRGKTYSQYTKDHQAAESDFTQAIQLDSTYIDSYIDRADERVSLQNIQGALADLDKAKQIDSTNPRIYYIQGKAGVIDTNFNKAIAGFSKAIALDSFYVDAYNDRAYAYYRLKEYAFGIDDCNKTISLNNAYFTAYYNKGMIYYEMGKPAVAIKLFDTTLAISDNLYFGYFYRGMAKKQLNDMPGACADWQKSVSLGFTMAEDTIKRYCK